MKVSSAATVPENMRGDHNMGRQPFKWRTTLQVQDKEISERHKISNFIIHITNARAYVQQKSSEIAITI